MAHVEATLSALMPALESHHIASWQPAEVQVLCAMLQEYGRQAREAKRGTSGNGHNHGGNADHTSSQHSEADEEKDGDEEEDEEEEAFVGAVGEVDRSLELVREYMRRLVPFGATAEPTVPAAAKATAAAAGGEGGDHGSRKRPRSPDAGTVTTAAPAPVFAVDAFLYKESDIEQLVAAGQLAREYCCRCGGTEIGLADFITHSFSKDQLVYLSCFLFPHLLDGVAGTGELARPLSIVDVGSRLGVVLWASAFALQWGLLAPANTTSGKDAERRAQQASESAAPASVQLIGVELDATFVKASHDVRRRFFAPRRRRAPKLSGVPGAATAAGHAEEELPNVAANLQLVESDCFVGEGAVALAGAAVVVLHNVFEYFCATAVEHARCWLKLRRVVCRPGQLLVCSPSLDDTLGGFSDAVWAQACALEGVEPVALATWRAAYVSAVYADEVATDFLTLRRLSREDKESDDEGEEDEDCGCPHEEKDGHSHHHHHHHRDDEHSSDEDGEADVAEVEEQVRRIYVYRVL